MPPASSGQPLSAGQARELFDRALARPEVRQRLGSSRFRLVRAGTGGSGAEGAAVLYVRDLQTGAARALRFDLVSGAVTVGDVPGLLQPGEEELGAARGIIERDPDLARWSAGRGVSLQGGFHVRPQAGLRDPCATDVCLEFGFMRADFTKGPARRVIVDLSRGAVAHRDYQGLRMTAGEPDGGEKPR